MFDDVEKYLNRVDEKYVVALIPARGGSKGVPQKNIQLIKGYPLIAYTIIAGKLSKYIDRTIVSTDSEEIAHIAGCYGAEVPFLRPGELADDQSGDFGFVEHAIKYLYNEEKRIPEYIVHLRPTTPFRDIVIMDTAINECMKNNESCSLRSGHLASESPFKWFIKNTEGYFESIKDGISNEDANSRRQAFPDVYIPDGYVDVLKSSYIIRNNKLHGRKMIAFESPRCIEIDTFDDLDYARYEIEENKLSLYDYLVQNFVRKGS